MSFRYSVGLQNVGSYQVSSQPWLKSASFTGVQSAFYEFPNVTDHIKITNDIAAAGTGNLDIVFCEPKRGIDFGGTAEFLTTTFTATDQLTASVWLKVTGTTANLLFLEIGGGNIIRVVSDGSSNIRFRVDGTNPAPSLSFSSFDWVNVTIVINGTSNKIYINGQPYLTNSGDAGTGLDTISIGGGSSAGYDGIYDELALFTVAFSDDEVAEMYNNGKSLKTSTHTKSSDLVSQWDFEDNNYKSFYATPDTTALIYDRVSANNLTLTGGTGTPLNFVDGRLLENALERHKITLEGQQEIRLNCKSKQVFLRSTGTTDVNVSAGLTGIPADRMFELTGTGIDE